MELPVLTVYDPITLSEGSIDPLGLYSIADRMGIRLAPGIRERQLHPLFLTAIAASAHICSSFDDERVASDGMSSPWQVCEWYIVEGIVRCAQSEADLVGLPGRNKAQDAIAEGNPISASRYLKTPSVFGFHGVYRLLARTLDVIDSYGNLGANGYELLVVWEREQEMRGFISGSGAGRSFYDRMREAVDRGLQRGSTNRSGSWSGWSEIYHALRHTRRPEQESKLIGEWLTRNESLILEEVYRHLLSPEGKSLWQDTNGNERIFHDFVRRSCSYELAELLEAISAYERFCRTINNAFYSMLVTLSNRQTGARSEDIAAAPHIIAAAERTPEYYQAAAELLDVVSLGIDFEQTCSSFAERLAPASWVDTLIRHHERVQKAKPLAGKLPWIERSSNANIFVRPPYVQRPEMTFPDEERYLHMYRTNSLWSFAYDLGLV